MAVLSIRVGGKEEKHPLLGPVVVLGRGLDCGIRIDDVKASRRHFQIVKTATGHDCVDLQSRNGTLVNGAKIVRRTLHAGDRIEVGSTTLVFLEEEAVAVPQGTARAGFSGAVTTRRTTSFVSGTQTFLAEARKKRASPVMVILGGIGVLFLVAVGVILFGDDEDLIAPQLRMLEDEAAVAWHVRDYPLAIAKYREALNLIEGKDKYRTKGMDIRAKIREIEAEQAARAGAERDIQQWLEKARAGAALPKQLWDEGQRILRAFKESGVRGTDEVEKALEEIGKQIGPKPGEDFHERRDAIRKKYLLDDRTGRADFGAAIGDWKRLLEERRDLSEVDRERVRGEIVLLNNLAYEELHDMRRRAKRGDVTVEDLLKQKPRFENTDSREALEKLIEEVGKGG